MEGCGGLWRVVGGCGGLWGVVEEDDAMVKSVKIPAACGRSVMLVEVARVVKNAMSRCTQTACRGGRATDRHFDTPWHAIEQGRRDAGTPTTFGPSAAS